jgi:hypothetical protein
MLDGGVQAVLELWAAERDPSTMASFSKTVANPWQ